MPTLLIKCRFIAHSYSGVRQGPDLREELDWPPAPGRLHQGLMACTLSNLPNSLIGGHAEPTLAALRWLEKFPPPEVRASRLTDDSDYRRALMVAMPHNSPAKPKAGGFASYHNDLAPVLRATPMENTPLIVEYQWKEDSHEFTDEIKRHLPALQDAAARLRYLGRAEDRVECMVRWIAEGEPHPEDCSLEVWRPSDFFWEIGLLVPRPESTQTLKAAFQNTCKRRGREAKPPARLCLREQGYIRNAVEGRLPVHSAIFQVYETGSPDSLVCDSINAHKYRSVLRNRACELSTDDDPWVTPELACELICGHTEDGKHAQQPHLAYVPLPSISLSGKGDGRVRRFALVGYASEKNTKAARSVYRTLAANLDGKFDCADKPSWQMQLVDRPDQDRVWRLYSGSSRAWASVTPVAISRNFSVPKFSPSGEPLSKNEQYLRKLAEWQKLLRDSLRHIALPEEVVNATEIEISMTPFIPKCERAEKFRAPGEKAVLTHVRLTFPEPIRGPLILGDRRYFGLGLCIPIQDGEK